MSHIDLQLALQEPEFLAEVHHLFWIKPFINHGQQELGWSCRDHALCLGLIAAMRGADVVLVTGEAFFVQGPSGGRSPVGIQQAPHSWLRTADGTFDVSWRLDTVRNIPQWKPWNARGVLAGKVAPAGAASFLSTTDRVRHTHSVNGATHLENGRVAAYLAETVDSLDAGLLSRQYAWVNSPLTDRLKKIGPNLYSAAALHLLSCLDGGESIRNLDQNAAWSALAIRYPDALDQTLDQIGRKAVQ